MSPPRRGVGAVGAAALAALSGSLYALSLPAAALDLLGWVALAPFFVAVATVPPGRAFALGLLWFFVASLGFASPMPHLVSAYFEAPWVVGAVAFLGFTVAFGPLYGLYGAWLSWLVRRRRANPLLAAAGLGVVEWARTGAGSIFGWALLAHTQSPGALLLQVAELGGAYLPGMILTATSYALASLVAPGLAAPHRTRWFAAATIAVALALTWGVVRTAPAGEPETGLRVAIVQGGIPHAERWHPARTSEHLEHYLDLTADTDLHEPDLIVWPEYALSFNLREDTEDRALLFEATTDGADLLFGAPFHRSAVPPIVQNSAFLLHDGALAARYDKNELLPFAERNPLPGLVPLDRVEYVPGRSARPIPVHGAQVGVFLCSEGLRPGVARKLTRNGATVLANLSNDSWLGTEAAARLQLRSAALRAIENRRPLLRATGSGKSAIVRADGSIAVESRFGAPDVLFGVVEPATEDTPYSRFGDVVARVALAIVGLGTALAAARPRRPSTPVQGDVEPS